MRKKEAKKREKYFAVSQVFLMVMSLFAFSFVIGESVVVSGETCYFRDSGTGEIVSSSFAGDCDIRLGVYPSERTLLQLEGVDEMVSPSETLPPSSIPTPPATTPTPTSTGDPVTAAAATTAASSSAAAEIGAILGSTTGSSETASATSVLENFNVEVTDDLLTQIESAGHSNIELYDNGRLKSWVDGDIRTTVGPNGVLTTEKIKTSSFLGIPFTGVSAHLIQGAQWALAVVGAIQLFGPMFGLEEETVSALSISSVAAIATWKGIDILVQEYKMLEFFKSCEYGLSCAQWTGVAVGVLVFLLLYSEENQKVVKFSCVPWQAPVGGNNCEECNDQDLPCSEYQCKSLGQSCEIINQGTTEEKCVWVNRQDVNPPTIEPWEEALLDDYSYNPDNSISPPDRGVKINYLKSQDNCIPAFTPLRFGVQLNEPAKCKIDVLRKENFEGMSVFMSNGIAKYEHSYALSLPGASALESENITLENNGNYELYTRCEDANGNSNTATFVFKYCVDPGPDTTAPVIVTTSVLNGVPISFNQSSLDLEVYVNEPSHCKWSHNDQDYENMDEEMTCSTSVFEYNAQMLYKCETSLTGLKNRVENKFYFRCKDQPSSPENERNANAESYSFSLFGTRPLVIDSIEPDNETVKDSTDPIKVTLDVETSSGHNEGESICYYSNSGNENSYIKFFETSSFEHKQDLFLSEGDYEYFIKCTDFGGNSDYENITFEVETDTNAPIVVRAYKEEKSLKIITNEEAQCSYSTFECNYILEEGTKFTTADDESHFTAWNTQNDLYVKCQDGFGNQPAPDKCNMIVRASDF